MKVLVLLDGSNFYHMLRARYQVIPSDLNWRALPHAILRRIPGAKLGETECDIRYYVGEVRRSEDPDSYMRQQSLFGKIRESGGNVWTGRLATRTREVRCPNCRHRFAPVLTCPKCGRGLPGEIKVEKGVDVKIAADAVEAVATGTYDTIVIGSRDGDFIPVAHAVLALRSRIFCLTAQVPPTERKAGKTPLLVSACTGAVWITRKFLTECGVKEEGT